MRMDEDDDDNFITKIVCIVLAVVAVFVLSINSCSVLGPTEKGILVTLGKPSEEKLESGMHFKLPFFQKIQKYDLTPIPYKKSLGIKADGALTADKQTIGIDYELFWKYDENRLFITAKSYKSKEAIYDRISTPLKEIIKDEIAKRDVNQIVGEMSSISKIVEDRLIKRLDNPSNPLPVKIEGLSIVNIDWSEDYDTQLKETANRTQQVKIAQQDAEIAAAIAQKKVKESEAEAQAAEFNKRAAIAKAQGEAEAAKIEADATAYKNLKLAQNISVMQVQWKHEEEMKRLERWNGKNVSDQSVYIPNTYDLKNGIK